MKPFSILRTSSTATAASHVAADPARRLLRAGGIDVLDRLKEGLDAPETVVDLAALTDDVGQRMSRSESTREGHVLGALVTLARVADTDALPAAVREAAGSAASPAIRNAATVGGNLLQRPRCWYFRDRDSLCLKKGGARCLAADGRNRYHAVLGGGPSWIVHPSTLATGLVAVGATVTVRAASGELTTTPLADLFELPSVNLLQESRLRPGDVLVEVTIPRSPQRSLYRAVKERAGFDWPLVEVAVAARSEGGVLHDVSVVLGQVAPIPWIARAAAAVLDGHPADPVRIERAAAAAFTEARPLGDNAYKIPMGQGLLRTALHELAGIPLP
jgi:xanthine dehydrogenase YagS FAD-binding subunit